LKRCAVTSRLKKMFKIVIPSMGRPNGLITPELFKGSQVVLTVYVHSREDEILYVENNPDINIVNLNVPPGVQNIRNAILEHNNPGDKLVFMDDDVNNLLRLSVDGKKIIPLNQQETIKFMEHAFSFCENAGANMWGVYPIKNAFYMSNRISPNNFIIGQVMGIVISEIRIDSELDLKEDYDLTIQHILRDKKVARFNNICINAKQRTNPGGCVTYRTKEKMLAASSRLIELYPKYVKLNPKREGEVLLKFKVKK